MTGGFYTGVGSRRAPPEMVDFATKLATALSVLWGYRVRTGGADGMDTGFERGDAHAQLLLPWNGYNGRFSEHCKIAPLAAYELVQSLHPAYDRLSGAVRSLHARNVLQVLGPKMDDPSKFLVCWTPDGCETEAERTRATGGTATAIVVAARHGVLVFNLAKPGSYDRLVQFLADLKLAP